MSEAHRDADWYEREYNPRLTVPDTAAIIDSWPARAEATRARYGFDADIAYGPHPREVMDVYHAENPRGTVVYIHGGYWRMLSKLETSWVVDGFVDRGVSVALLNYPLCPDVGLDQIVESTRRAFATLWRGALNDDERRRVVVTGHSAGGYLTALHLATDWKAYGLPADPLVGAVSLSGIFDLAPLMHTSMNEAIRLTKDMATSLSLVGVPIRSKAPLVLAVGGDETAEFHRQSEALADGWPDLEPRVVEVPGANHFTIVDDLAHANGHLNRIVMELIDGPEARGSAT